MSHSMIGKYFVGLLLFYENLRASLALTTIFANLNHSNKKKTIDIHNLNKMKLLLIQYSIFLNCSKIIDTKNIKPLKHTQ